MKFRKIEDRYVGQAADYLSQYFCFDACEREDLEQALSRALYIGSGDDDLSFEEIRRGTNSFIDDLAQKNHKTYFWVPLFLTEGQLVYYEKNQRNYQQLNLFEMNAPFLSIDSVMSKRGLSDDYNVIMSKNSHAFALDFEDFQNLAMKNASLWHTAIDCKIKFAEAFSASTRIFLAPTTRIKIAQYLYFYVSRRVEKGYPPVIENVTQEMFASSFGISRTTVSEAFMELKRMGAVEPGYRKVTVNLERCLEAIDDFSRDIQDK